MKINCWLMAMIMLIGMPVFAQEEDTAAGANIPVRKHQAEQIYTFAPIQFTENGVGFSLGYERSLDKNAIVALSLPLVVTFRVNSDNDYNTTNTPSYDPMVYLMPGLKFYPTGSYKKIAYSIGPSFVVGAGQYTSYNNSNVKTVADKFIFGTLINNGLNINPSAHFYIGMDLGLGFSYVHTQDGTIQDPKFLTQGGFKIGYRL